jgi:hypothetical protein
LWSIDTPNVLTDSVGSVHRLKIFHRIPNVSRANKYGKLQLTWSINITVGSSEG